MRETRPGMCQVLYVLCSFLFVHLSDVCIKIVEKEMMKPFMCEKSSLWLSRPFVWQEKMGVGEFCNFGSYWAKIDKLVILCQKRIQYTQSFQQGMRSKL
jgi:hypothetical protein